MRGKSQWKGKEAAVPTGGEQVTADHQETGEGWVGAEALQEQWGQSEEQDGMQDEDGRI